MKKRVISLLLTVVLLVAAVNYIPVKKADADNGEYAASLSGGDIATGHWKSGESLRYYEDGEYSSHVASDESDPAYKTRHVTVFNDCDAHYNSDYTGATKVHQIQYSSNTDNKKNLNGAVGTWVTNRGNVFTSDDPHNGLDIDTQAPFLIDSAGCTIMRNSNEETSARFQPKDGTDCRMIFRNFYNTDYTRYNYPGKNKTPGGDKNLPGIDISSYDYLEFKIKVDSGINLNRKRDDGQSTYRVYLYYETNDGSGDFLNTTDNCVDNYSGPAFDFSGQLFDANGNFTQHDQWITIRCSLDCFTSTTTIKQITIRMLGGMEIAENTFIRVDDICLVKNDDHIGYVYDSATTGDRTYDLNAEAYPSGEYFMVNDFETLEGVRQGSSCYSTDYTLVRRYEDVNTDDSQNKAPAAGYGWAESSANYESGSTLPDFQKVRRYSSAPKLVTQGEYATVLQARPEDTYDQPAYYTPTTDGSATGDVIGDQGIISAFYYRKFKGSMDLSEFTHFSIDVNLRSLTDNRGIQNDADYETAQKTAAVLFVLSLITDNGNTKEIGYDIQFKLVYKKHSYELQAGGQTQILPLTSTGGVYHGADPNDTTQTNGITPHGAMRFVFTREDIMKWYTANSDADLSNITAMKFAWLNGAEGDPSDTSYACDIVLDNFIAYTPDTTMTIQNKLVDADADDQNFVYKIYGGYETTDTALLTDSQTGKIAGNGKDPVTDDIDLSVAVPANGSVTIRNLPFNSYYITQTNWSWRYKIGSATSDLEEKATAYYGSKYTIENLLQSGNTIAIVPRVSWCRYSGTNGTIGGFSHTDYVACSYNHTIIHVMKQRNFTVTIQQKVISDRWLDGNGNASNVFNSNAAANNAAS